MLQRLVNKLQVAGQRPHEAVAEDADDVANVQLIDPKIVSLISTMHGVSTSEKVHDRLMCQPTCKGWSSVAVYAHIR